MTFTRQSIVSLALTTGYAAMMLAVSILSARLMVLAEFGVYASVMGHVLILSALTSGLPQLLVREITGADLAGDAARLHGLIRWSIGWVLLSGAVVLAAAAAMAFDAGAAPGWWRAFLFGSGVLIGFGLLNVTSAVLRALDRPVLGQIPASTLRPALQIIGIVALVSLMTLTAERAILILLAATGLSVVAAFWMLRRRLRGTRAAVPSYQSRVWFIALATISVTILCQRINQHLGTVLLQYLSNAEAVALYQPAVEALILTSLPGLAVTAILMPRLRTALVGGDHALQQRLITGSGRLIAVCTLAVSAFLLLLGPGGLALIFGTEFGAAYPAVAVIAVTQALAAFLGLPNVVLAQAHRERRVAVTMTGGVVANIAASLMVIPMFGPLGAAVATGLTLLVVRAVLSRACRRDLGLETRITFRVEKACSP